MVMCYNECMTMRRGFTLIEVSLFLAVTALLFVGITAGTQNSINQQRKSDAINGFADFLRNVYSEVSNPQSNGKGTSDQAIYGRLITFGESKALDGENNENKRGIFVYDVLGDVSGDFGSGSSLQNMLKELDVTVFYEKRANNGVNAMLSLVGQTESYSPRWQSEIENTTRNSGPISAAILIVRHPRSGTINTLVLEGSTLEINNAARDLASGTPITINSPAYTGTHGILKGKIDEFQVKEINFCVDTFGENNNERRNVRIVANARNSSGVQVIDQDTDDNKCVE